MREGKKEGSRMSTLPKMEAFLGSNPAAELLRFGRFDPLREKEEEEEEAKLSPQKLRGTTE